MEIEMTVRLLIPDTTAITTFHAIEKMGIGSVRKLKRDDYYKFGCDGDFKKVSEDLGKVDVIVNANKHKYFAKKPGEPFSGDFEGMSNVRVLVQDIDDKDGGLLSMLKERLGFTNVSSVEKGVLWTLGIDASGDEAENVAKEVAENLLSNKHCQQYRIVG